MIMWLIKPCTFFLILGVILASFICKLIIDHYEHGEEIERLRLDFDSLMQRKVDRNPVRSEEKLKESTILQQFGEIIDNTVKKKLSGIWDDIFNIRQQIKTLDCTKHCGDMDNKNALVKSKNELINYADEDLGARIIDVKAEPVEGSSFIKRLLNMEFTTNQPINMLRSSMKPGNCFGFQSKTATVEIKLARRILMDSIELEHISSIDNPDKSTNSAPREFQIDGISDLAKNKPVHIGKFVFNNCPDHLVQVYKLPSKISVVGIHVKFISNHGNPRFTCVYRLAVYGTPIHS